MESDYQPRSGATNLPKMVPSTHYGWTHPLTAATPDSAVVHITIEQLVFLAQTDGIRTTTLNS